jgi:multidrug efflux pump subunit AcrB
MKQKVSSFSIILIFICLALVGLAFIPFLTVKLAPSQMLQEITISFSMPGNASRVIEIEATSKLESMLSRIKGVESIMSTSGNGWGSITISFDEHVNIDAARFEVSTIIRQTWPRLPQNTSYPSISLSRSDDNAARPFMAYTVNAPATPALIQQFTENTIKSKLAQIDGINHIDVRGATPMEWRLEYDYKQLEVLNLDIRDVQTAISNHLTRKFLGTASIEDDDGGKQWIRIALTSEDTETNEFDPTGIKIKNADGRLISLNDIVTITHTEAEPQRYYRINGLNSIYIYITAEENANQLELSKKIKNKLEELQPIFPVNYDIYLNYDATEYIQNELDKVYFRASLTLVILLLFVLFIYRSFKYLLLIFLSLVINIAVAVIFYYWSGLEIQLYSLAGITISLTLVIDNTIIMSDQIIKQHNKKAFLAILAATVTTIASLVIIFFMDEKIRLNLQDFALVIIINLSVSLSIALFLIPSLLEKLNIGKQQRTKNIQIKKQSGLFNRFFTRCKIKAAIFFNRFYYMLCCVLWRWRALACIFIILLFGLPIFLLPDKLNGESKWAELYNKTIGSVFYKETIRPHANVLMGGTLRLFVQKVFEGSYFVGRQETSIYVTATLPNGSTIAQMNNLIQQMEGYISQFSEVRQFQTNINNARRANITIQFTKQAEQSGFPYLLKSKLISKALEMGGGSWAVYGLGDGFDNDVSEQAGSYRVILRGFNYDELMELAEKFKSKLLEHRRIKEVIIRSEFSWYKDDYQEYSFTLNYENLAHKAIQPFQLFSSLRSIFGQDIVTGQFPGEFGMEKIILYSKQSTAYDIWSLEHIPGKIGEDSEYKLSELARLTKIQSPQNIVKEDQQYRLCLQFEYVGTSQQGSKVLKRTIDEFTAELPMGYSIENDQQYWSWGRDNSKQYGLLLLIFVIIYFMCSILFNSFKQPLVVIFVIPIAFIGIFLTFYLFRLNFDQGGFASFILICGISVNANIYILNEYNNIRKKKNLSPLKAYLKAWNAKISPIFLTVISTILGFIPFMIGAKEAFWFPLAAGTIGGLIMSLIGTFFFLPLFMGVAKKRIP